MADPITGAVVSSLVKLIFDKLGSPVFTDIRRSFGVKTELKRLIRTLSSINAVLLDAEEKQTTLHSVNDWLLNLKEVAHDIEYVLDLISTQALEKKVHQRSMVPRLGQLFPQCSLARKLKDIRGRLEEISANRRDFNFEERHLSVAPPAYTSGERDRSSFVQESNVFGRKQDQDWIFCNFMVSSSSQEISKIPILAIVGLCGMGKTTLARLVFNDPRVQENFSLKLWVSMPNIFSKKIAMEKMFECATGEKSSDSNMQAIENRLHDILAGQTLVLVLDNLWLQDPRDWLDLLELLEKCSKGSRIVVTAREVSIARYAATLIDYWLGPLCDNDCWSIFAKCAFIKDEEEAYPSLVKIGKEIVKKCRGAPLAARTLGSLLWNVVQESEWRAIEESELWEIEQGHTPCFSF